MGRSCSSWLALALALLPAWNARAEEPLPPGGVLTRTTDNRNSFALPAPTLTAADLRRFNFGNRVFNTNWVVAPASVPAFDGLGPTFNRVSCSGCHLRDGRGRPPIEGETELLSMLLRVSVPGTDAHGGPKPHPAYGDQLADRAIPGVPAEARIEIRWHEREGRYDDGTPYSLRRPEYLVHDAAFGGLGSDTLLSPRVASHVTGGGLLEAVDEADILALADPDDADGDGISGRPNRVWNLVSGQVELGRFGWKANAATLLQQSAAAAHGDIGLTSRWFPHENCPPVQVACRAAAVGDTPDLSDEFLDKLVFYLRTLAVPARRNLGDPQLQRGEALFGQARCSACHVPRLATRADAEPALLASQVFAPYTDLLLHDMGEGLADGRPDFLAGGSEWRTPPLWGLGLVPVVNDHLLLLHDGRARGFEEAVLWHGGEAEAARRAFLAMGAADRAALVAFLRSL